MRIDLFARLYVVARVHEKESPRILRLHKPGIEVGRCGIELLAAPQIIVIVGRRIALQRAERGRNVRQDVGLIQHRKLHGFVVPV